MPLVSHKDPPQHYPRGLLAIARSRARTCVSARALTHARSTVTFGTFRGLQGRFYAIGPALRSVAAYFRPLAMFRWAVTVGARPLAKSFSAGVSPEAA